MKRLAEKVERAVQNNQLVDEMIQAIAAPNNALPETDRRQAGEEVILICFFSDNYDDLCMNLVLKLKLHQKPLKSSINTKVQRPNKNTLTANIAFDKKKKNNSKLC